MENKVKYLFNTEARAKITQINSDLHCTRMALAETHRWKGLHIRLSVEKIKHTKALSLCTEPSIFHCSLLHSVTPFRSNLRLTTYQIHTGLKFPSHKEICEAQNCVVSLPGKKGGRTKDITVSGRQSTTLTDCYRVFKHGINIHRLFFSKNVFVVIKGAECNFLVWGINTMKHKG